MSIDPPTPLHAPAPEQVAFHRTELNVLMGIYGRMVAAGEWRDYGLSFLREMAVFSVFKRTAENPVYRIEKRQAAHEARAIRTDRHRRSDLEARQ